jgi:iron complex outermembrane receptor protein
LSRALLAGAAAAAVGTDFAAAQTTPTTKAPGQTAAVGEVVVTAQRRSERARDVPISITSKSGAQLDRARVTTMEDLNTVAPGVRIDDAGSYVQPSIRGIAATVIGPGTDEPVGIYLDGVFQPNMQTTHFDLPDIDRVEVLKGPQGTLYGRDAMGGAITIFTKQPSFTPQGDFELGYGNYDDLLVKGFLTGPIIQDKLAGSISVFHENHKDYDYNIVLGSHAKGLNSTIVRAKLMFTPTGWAKITLIGGYINRLDSDIADGEPLNGNSIGRLDPGDIFTTVPHHVALNVNQQADLSDYYVTLDSEFKTPYGVLTSIASYQYSWSDNPLDDDRTYDLNGAHDAAYFNITKNPTSTIDVNFASNEFGPFSFIAGGSYFYDNAKWAPIDVGGPFGSTLFLATEENPIWAYAGYFEATYHATDRLTFIGGFRYNWEHRNVKENQYLPNGMGGFFQFAGSGFQTPTTFSSTIPRASVRYKVSDNTNVYFTYSQGFKSGGIAQPNQYFTLPGLEGVVYQAGATYKPEKITGYEIGVKSSPTHRISVNASAFYYDYTDLQVQVDLGFATKLIENAATARVYGFDTDFSARVTDEFTLQGAFAWTSAHYVSYTNADGLVPCPHSFGNCDNNFDASHNWLPRAPNLTLSVTGDYRKDFTAGTLDLNATFYYSGRVWFDSIMRVSQAPYGTLAAQASWQPAGTHLRFEIWGKNLTNTKYYTSVYIDSQSDGANYAPPPTFGVAVKYSFNGMPKL